MYKYKSITMILEEQGYAYADLTIVPAVISKIKSRKECNIFYEDGNLPIFAAPMMTVVNEYNYKIYEENKINVIIPRTVKYKQRIEFLNNEKWVAFSLKEFIKLFCTFGDDDMPRVASNKTYKVLIDMADGHMQDLYTYTFSAKHLAHNYEYNLIIMVGNIANPETYRWICTHTDVDYVRLAIGSGSNCLTTNNVGEHYPIATLIDKCKQIKEELIGQKQYYEPGTEWVDIKCIPYIVADGGIKVYADVNKALALGADYVMIGGLFGSLLESSADMIIESRDSAQYPAVYDGETGKVVYYTSYGSVKLNIWNGNTEEEKKAFIRSVKNIKKRLIGMSTKEAQIAIARCLEEPVELTPDMLKTSEGNTTFVECKYTMKQWLENMMDYLRSAMSYNDCYTLDEFKNNCDLIVNSPAEIQAVHK